MVLDLLADGEGVEQLPAATGRESEGVCDRIRAERESADGAGCPAPGCKAIQAQSANHRESVARHRGEPRIDIKGRALPGREQEVTAPHRARQEQILERI